MGRREHRHLPGRLRTPTVNDLDGERKTSKPFHEFGIVNHHMESFAGVGYYLLAQQRTTATFNEVPFFIHLVGTVDGNIDHLRVRRVDHVYPRFSREYFRFKGASHRADV